MSAHPQPYPITEFLASLTERLGKSESEFVLSLGYRNVQRGLRRLNAWLDQGEGFEKILGQIEAAYPLETEALRRAVENTRQVKAEEVEAIRKEATSESEERARVRFRPFVWVRTEDGAHSFLTAMAERQVKVLWMSENFDVLSESEQLAVVRKRVREHYNETGGRYIGFGAILGYQFAQTFDTSIMLDTTGSTIDEHGGQFLLPELWLQLHPA